MTYEGRHIMATSQRILASPFLPSIPAIAADDLGRVVFPGTTRAGRGLLTTTDRDPHAAENDRRADGPTTYTRPPTDTREGGLYPVRILGRPAKAFR
jgi:hypothetical protein